MDDKAALSGKEEGTKDDVITTEPSIQMKPQNEASVASKQDLPLSRDASMEGIEGLGTVTASGGADVDGAKPEYRLDK
jgi:hypothetical protein